MGGLRLSNQPGNTVPSLQPQRNGADMKGDLKLEPERNRQQIALEEELLRTRTLVQIGISVDDFAIMDR